MYDVHGCGCVEISWMKHFWLWVRCRDHTTITITTMTGIMVTVTRTIHGWGEKYGCSSSEIEVTCDE